MKDIIKLGSILFIVCALAAGSLAVIYQGTKGAISKNKKEKQISLRKSVLKTAARFEKVEGNKNIFIGYDEEGNNVGKVVVVNTSGYSGALVIIVGLDNESKITGVKIATQTETPGLGSKIEKESFLDQFIGLDDKEVYLKRDARDGKIDAITGATISSRAVTEGIRSGIINGKKNTKTNYKDGIYRGQERGHGGVVQVTVKINKGSIVSIDANAPYETKSHWSKVISTIKPQVLKKQTIEGVDTVSGATISSRAFLKAINKALEKSVK